MKKQFRFVVAPQYRAILTKKPWFACFLLLALAFTLAEFIYLLKISLTPFPLSMGIALGMMAENSFDLETLFVSGFIILMIVALIAMASTVFLSASLFKLIFILAAVMILSIVTTIIMQWLIKNWICRTWGKGLGVVISAIAIGLGIMLQGVLVTYLL